jgi:hypothetical protein
MGKRTPKWANVHFGIAMENVWKNSLDFSASRPKLGQNKKVTVE